MKKLIALILFAMVLYSVADTQEESVQKRADTFLEFFNPLYRRVYTVASEAEWKASTDVKDQNTGERIGANKAFSVFIGDPYFIEQSQEFLKSKDQLKPITVRQLNKILYAAAHSPGTVPDLVNRRVEAEAEQSATLDGYQFCLERKGNDCSKPITPNMIDEALVTSNDLNQRKKYWDVSKEIGAALKPGLIELQELRNKIAQATGFSSYFALEVSDFGMNVKEMMDLNEKIVSDLKPLYQQLHTWAKYKLAERYKQPVPKMIPAHWLGNRWGQAWPGLAEGVDLDPLVKNKSPEWLIKQAERFYMSMGMPAMPETFWTKSDLYELPPDAPRKKNTHASAWHIDLDKDVRSLMSVKANFRWFETTHHELGHIYYYIAYSNPDVPVLLRSGANRAFHEGIGYLIASASRQIPYLKEIKLMPHDAKIDQTQWLLNEALDNAVIFQQFSAGTMTHWEHDFYEKNLSKDEFNKRWWEYAMKYQGIEPPSSRGEEYCDAATKTHINDDPAQYYDYALSYVVQYQLHDYIAKKILKQDPHSCNYYGNKEVGKFLTDILKLGATRDWREVIKEKTGEELSTRAMVEYFQPLMEYLQKENAGRNTSWE
jgi:peptidyl-dipeptidase A